MDISSKTKILKQLARTSGEIAENACEKEATKIAAALANETRYDLLEQQVELLDIIAFRVSETAVNIIRDFLGRLETLEVMHPDEPKIPRHLLADYQNNNDLAAEVLGLLDRIRYHRLEDILEIFMSYCNSENEKVRSRAIQGLHHLAEYNIEIFYPVGDRPGYGPGPQVDIVKYLGSLEAGEKQKYSSAIVELCSQLLSPSMTSTSSDYKTFTWTTASIPAIDEIKKIRNDSLRLLRELYDAATITSRKSSIINTMLTVMNTPQQGEYGDDVLDMIWEGALKVLAFFKDIVPGENLQIIQKIEHDSFWQFRRSPSKDVKSAALDVRDLIAVNDEYTIYRNLVGFNGVFEDWEESLSNDSGYQEIQNYRSEKSNEYANSINENNWAEWRDRIFRFAKTESEDLATFPVFYGFLEQIAKKSPDLALSLLTENLDDISSFTIPLLRGLWKGSRKADLRVLMLEWVEADRQLIAIAKLFLSNDDIDEELLQILLNKAEEETNREILIMLVGVAASNYANGHEDLVQNTFLPAVKLLTKINDAGWVHELWYRRERSDILRSLGGEGQEIILSGLLLAENIDYHAEELLIPLAKENPERIIKFFGERLRYKEEVDREGRYDAIPFRFYKLHDTLSDFPDVAVNTVRRWFKRKAVMFPYRGANLLKIIFPNLTKPFEAKLFELVQSGERQDIEFVLSVLNNYEGEPFLHGVCRAIVVMLPENDELLSRVGLALRSTGVVSGEFGFAEAYERKIEEIKPWLKDENKKVRNFAADYITGRKKEAESERRRAEEKIELRKHAYGVREEEADEEGGDE